MKHTDQENKNSNDISRIQNDIQNIKEDMGEVKLDLKAVLGHYIQREEFEKNIKEIERKLDLKVNVEDFTPWKTTLRNINWLLIAAFLGSVFTLVLK